MVQFFNEVLAGQLGCKGIVDFLKNLFELNVKGNGEIMGLWDSIIGAVASVLPIVLIALGALELFFGKKLLGLQKFVFSAALGYVLGIVVLTPAVSKIFELPAMVCGIACAVVAAVLFKFIYAVLLFGGVGIFGYALFFANGLIPMVLPTEGNQVLSFAGAGILIFLVLIFRKNIERLGTAYLGAFLIIDNVIKNYYDFTTLLAGYEDLFRTAAIIVVALLGFLFQYKRRRRY